MTDGITSFLVVDLPPRGHRALGQGHLLAIARQAKLDKAEVSFWDGSGFRADAVRGKTWAAKGRTPVVQRPGQRQSISAASAVNAKVAFWFETYEGALTGELFVALLTRMMAERDKPVHLVVDGLPAHKKAVVKQYVAGTQGLLTRRLSPGYAPDLNPDELMWPCQAYGRGAALCARASGCASASMVNYKPPLMILLSSSHSSGTFCCLYF